MKLIWFALLLYAAYRFIIKPMLLPSGKQSNAFSQDQNNPSASADDEDDYIDYEEVK